MKPSAIFINMARGPIHQEKDLALAIKEGLILAAMNIIEFYKTGRVPHIVNPDVLAS